ncbi:MAG: hypothetical protein GF418_01970 [Chitinivibrionales bacterium]|nr:hypothetical protein [Chitinivibrionales bacterium]MBD3394367.1 hypothetical protein [Chitinivibrionales bacterium]
MRTAVLISAVTAVLSVFVPARAEDMYLTLEDGVSVILHTDYTWDYEKGGEVSRHLEEPISLDDGSTLVLKKDGTWGFVAEGLAGGTRKPTNLTAVNAVGVSKRSALDEARAGAMEEAIERLSKQLRDASPELADAPLQTVIDCVTKEEKAVETREEQLDLWKATVKLSLDATGIQNVFHCVRTVQGLGVE